jgi:hypothetical protein
MSYSRLLSLSFGLLSPSFGFGALVIIRAALVPFFVLLVTLIDLLDPLVIFNALLPYLVKFLLHSFSSPVANLVFDIAGLFDGGKTSLSHGVLDRAGLLVYICIVRLYLAEVLLKVGVDFIDFEADWIQIRWYDVVWYFINLNT